MSKCIYYFFIIKKQKLKTTIKLTYIDKLYTEQESFPAVSHFELCPREPSRLTGRACQCWQLSLDRTDWLTAGWPVSVHSRRRWPDGRPGRSHLHCTWLRPIGFRHSGEPGMTRRHPNKSNISGDAGRDLGLSRDRRSCWMARRRRRMGRMGIRRWRRRSVRTEPPGWLGGCLRGWCRPRGRRWGLRRTRMGRRKRMKDRRRGRRRVRHRIRTQIGILPSGGSGGLARGPESRLAVPRRSGSRRRQRGGRHRRCRRRSRRRIRHRRRDRRRDGCSCSLMEPRRCYSPPKPGLCTADNRRQEIRNQLWKYNATYNIIGRKLSSWKTLTCISTRNPYVRIFYSNKKLYFTPNSSKSSVNKLLKYTNSLLKIEFTTVNR